MHPDAAIIPHLIRAAQLQSRGGSAGLVGTHLDEVDHRVDTRLLVEEIGSFKNTGGGVVGVK